MEGMGMTSDADAPDFWRGRRVLVTGATGFIGSWLVKALLQMGADVVAFIRDADPQSELYRSGDILRVAVANGALQDFWALQRCVSEYEVEIVFHLGAQSIVGAARRSPIPTLESNIRGTYNLLEVCRLLRDTVRGIVIASSDKAYGEQPRLPYTEDMPLTGPGPYEVSKSCADLIAQAYHRTYGLPLAIARCGNVYGGGDLNWSRIVPGTIRSLICGRPPAIRSDGSYLRDYIYVKDISRPYILLAERLHDHRVRGEAFNFGTESPLSALALVRVIQEEMGCERIEPRIINSAKGEIRDQYLSCGKARSTLGWRAQYELTDGLRETIAWYRAFLQHD